MRHRAQLSVEEREVGPTLLCVMNMEHERFTRWEEPFAWVAACEQLIAAGVYIFPQLCT